jgi:uncharacterized protein YjbK/ferredoxin
MQDIIDLIKEYNIDYGIASFSGYTYFVLFLKYTPYNSLKDNIFIDSFYPAYQRVRNIKLEILPKITALGYNASEKIEEPYKEIAVKTGKVFMLYNTLTAYESYGTFFTMEVIKVEGSYNSTPSLQEADLCKGCFICKANCPTGALNNGFNRSLCIMELQNKGIPNFLAETAGNRVLGCNVCQLCCPVNAGIEAVDKAVIDVYEFAEACFSKRAALERFAPLLGKNYIRVKKMQRCLINALTNLNIRKYDKEITHIALHENTDTLLAEAAKRYLERFGLCPEWEIKYLITEEAYNSLNEKAVKQTNYYFCGKEAFWCRIREKEGKYTLTHKKRITDNFESLEINLDISKQQAEEYLKNGIKGEEVSRLFNVCFTEEVLLFSGTLITYRKRVLKNGFAFDVDKSEYLGTTDFEIECEVETADQYIAADKLIKEIFKTKKSKPKTGRFLERLSGV